MPRGTSREVDLNRPLRKLAERLRSLQQETSQALEAARNESRGGAASSASGDRPANLETQIGRRAAALLERWDIPTRAEFEELAARLEDLEAEVEDLRGERPREAAGTSKTRRERARAPARGARRKR